MKINVMGRFCELSNDELRSVIVGRVIIKSDRGFCQTVNALADTERVYVFDGSRGAEIHKDGYLAEDPNIKCEWVNADVKNNNNACKKRRKKLDLTQEELSDIMKVPRQTIESWEVGEKAPRKTAMRFADVLIFIKDHSPSLFEELISNNFIDSGV